MCYFLRPEMEKVFKDKTGCNYVITKLFQILEPPTLNGKSYWEEGNIVIMDVSFGLHPAQLKL